MEITEAKRLVIQAGHDLVTTGLIARTWGNVSCRVSEDLFVITPSGRNYLTLTEEEIVPVHISSLCHQGMVTPSSEKRIHAGIYRMDPQAGFLIHTHQENASVVSALGVPLPVPEPLHQTLGLQVPCAKYALPGTRSLSHYTVKAYSQTAGGAVMLKRHGVLCAGIGYEEAFRASFQLEQLAEQWLQELRDSAEAVPSQAPSRSWGFSSAQREGDGFFLEAHGNRHFLSLGQTLPGLEEECAVLSRVFQDYRELCWVEALDSPGVRFAISQKVPLLTWLDDFAQMVGTRLSILPSDPEVISRSLKRVSAALVADRGALCFGKTKGDVQAVSQLLEKNCKTAETALLYSSLQQPSAPPSPINWAEAGLMRRNYLKRYSKKY